MKKKGDGKLQQNNESRFFFPRRTSILNYTPVLIPAKIEISIIKRQIRYFFTAIYGTFKRRPFQN
jgi:hypothetical protein